MEKETIIRLFYIEHLKVKEIAQEINTSSAYITKIIKKDPRYLEEKILEKNYQKKKEKLTKIILIRKNEN